MATSAHSPPTWVRSLSIPTARVPLRMQLPACTLQPLFLTAGQSCLAFKRTPGLPPSSTSRSNSARKIVSLNRSWEAPGPVGNFKVSGTLGGKTVTVPIERAVDQMLCRELDEKFTREAGYQGGKTALYALVAAVRPKQIKPLIRFEGLPGEFSQHDFGEVAVTFLDGSIHRIHFFASRLKYWRFICVSVVKDQAVESLVRNLAEHLDRWGGAPLMCVFDRPKTVALKWQRNGEVTEWNPVFAYVMLELGVGVELCWPH